MLILMHATDAHVSTFAVRVEKSLAQKECVVYVANKEKVQLRRPEHACGLRSNEWCRADQQPDTPPALTHSSKFVDENLWNFQHLR